MARAIDRAERDAQELAFKISMMEPGDCMILKREDYQDTPPRSLLDNRPPLERLKDMVVGGRRCFNWVEQHLLETNTILVERTEAMYTAKIGD